MKQVTQEQFFAVVGQMNVSPAVRGRYSDEDYGSDFRTPSGELVGRTMARGTSSQWKPDTDYFLANF